VPLQWEDFANIKAVPILERCRDKVCSYNDDIQGARGTGGKLADRRFLFLGGGSAATGVAELFAQAMVLEGLDISEGPKRNGLFDSDGLMVSSRDDLAGFRNSVRDQS
jgi:malate dehydrogenase (oxaloacetate-decarboxylating)(NADP+)